MVCSEHVKEQIFVRRRKRLHKWWFAFLLCVDRVSDGIRIGALWLAVQCGKERLTPSQQVFEHSRLLSNYRVHFFKVSFSEFAECGELTYLGPEYMCKGGARKYFVRLAFHCDFSVGKR